MNIHNVIIRHLVREKKNNYKKYKVDWIYVMIWKETSKKIKYVNKYVKNIRIEFDLLSVIDFTFSFDLIYL